MQRDTWSFIACRNCSAVSNADARVVQFFIRSPAHLRRGLPPCLMVCCRRSVNSISMLKRPRFGWIGRGFRGPWIGFGLEICALIKVFLTSRSFDKKALIQFGSSTPRIKPRFETQETDSILLSFFASACACPRGAGFSVLPAVTG